MPSSSSKRKSTTQISRDGGSKKLASNSNKNAAKKLPVRATTKKPYGKKSSAGNEDHREQTRIRNEIEKDNRRDIIANAGDCTTDEEEEETQWQLQKTNRQQSKSSGYLKQGKPKVKEKCYARKLSFFEDVQLTHVTQCI